MQKSKSTKNKYDGIKAIVIKRLAEKHEVTYDYVRKALRSDRTSETAETIKREYPVMYKAVKTSLAGV